MFDIGAMEFLVLGILALFIFGPERLPDVARQAARGLRTIRAMAANARRDFSKELGADFENFDLADLNPRRFVRKHLLEDVDKELSISKDDLTVDLGGKSRTSRSKSSANGTSTKTATDAAKSTAGGGTADRTVSTGEPTDATSTTDIGSNAGADSGAPDDVVDAQVVEEPAGVALLVRQPPPPFDLEAT